MHPAVLYQLEYVIRVCKRRNVKTSICGQAGSKKEMVKFLVERGIDSISVNADVAHEITNYVKEIEENMVKGTDKEPRKYNPRENSEEQRSSDEFKRNSEEIIPIKGIEKLKEKKNN
jgi:phosphoenolpyruvate-protein kinase (PTS system EI component)